MKRLIFFFVSFFCFSVLADGGSWTKTYTHTFTPSNTDWYPTGISVPENATEIVPAYDGAECSVGAGLSPENSSQAYGWTLRSWPGKGTTDAVFFVRWYSPDGASHTLSWTVNGTGSAPPDPDNPVNPTHQTEFGHALSPCPKGCGVCLTCTPGHAVWSSQLERLVYACETFPGSGDGNDAPWAREATLQALGSGFRNWGAWQRETLGPLPGKLDTTNHNLTGIQGQLSSINSQQINNQQTFASYMDTLFNSYINPLLSNSNTANGHLNNLNTNLGTANDHLNNLKSEAATANTQLTDLRDKAATTNQNVSDTRQFTEQIKNSLEPNNVTSPTLENPTDDITPNTSAVSTIKNKLFPRYSFFANPGGSQFPEWSFTLPLQSMGWRDFTITFGGSAWSTVGGGILVTLMQFIRTLSKFVFYFIFLRCIILYLRQW